jgi:hypothetical protein
VIRSIGFIMVMILRSLGSGVIRASDLAIIRIKVQV